MSTIVAFGNQKGGVGKSTLISLCANALSQEPFSLKVCVLDTDPQASLQEARAYDLEALGEERQAPYAIFALDAKHFAQRIAEFDAAYDIVLVDTAGRLDQSKKVEEQAITKVLMYVDMLFVPFRAGSFNLDASLSYLRTAHQIQKLREKQSRKLSIVSFVNMYKERSSSNRQLLREIEALKEQGLVFMDCHLRQYALFEDSNTFDSLYDVNTSQTAKLNFSLWLNEFVKHLNNG